MRKVNLGARMRSKVPSSAVIISLLRCMQRSGYRRGEYLRRVEFEYRLRSLRSHLKSYEAQLSTSSADEAL